MADLLAMSSRIIDSGTAEDLVGPINRINHELSELGTGISMVEAFSHSVLFATDAGLVVFDTSGAHGGARVVGHDNVPKRFRRYDTTNGCNQVINGRQFGGRRCAHSPDAHRCGRDPGAGGGRHPRLHEPGCPAERHHPQCAGGRRGAGNTLAERAMECADNGDLRLACHLVELASQAAPGDAGIQAMRGAVYQRRRDCELLLMAKGSFGHAARESRTIADPDADS